MAPQKTKSRNSQPLVSDYETDDAAALSVQPPSPRSNDQLNLKVLRRHEPAATAILSIASYSVLYVFSPTSQQWEKSGVEGTLFVCQLAPSAAGVARFSVVILNRRSMDNFITELTSTDDVELTDDFVILKAAGEDASHLVVGVWVFSEPPPSSTANAREVNARMIQECARMAESSRKAMEQLKFQSPSADSEASDDAAESVPMGRQLSLRELFGQQREQDAGFSIHQHNSPQPPSLANFSQPQKFSQSQARVEVTAQTLTPRFTSTPDTDFFLSAPKVAQRQTKQVKPNQAPRPASGSQDASAPDFNMSNVDLMNLYKQSRAQGHTDVVTPWGTFSVNNYIQADDARIAAQNAVRPAGPPPVFKDTWVPRGVDGKKGKSVVKILTC